MLATPEALISFEDPETNTESIYADNGNGWQPLIDVVAVKFVEPIVIDHVVFEASAKKQS